MEILFIGGTGNISTECAQLLHRRGHKIDVISRGLNAVPGEYQSVGADRKDPASMRLALGKITPDIVINFLGYELADVELDFNLLRGAIRQYIFISSATVYQKPPVRLPFTEEGPFGNPWWEYAQKKLACEQYLLQQQREVGFPVTIVRPSHTYSKIWVPNPISSASFTFALRLKQGKPVFVPDDGENPWTLTAASDFALGLAGLVNHPQALGESFHITSDEVLTWNQITREIADAVDATSPDIVPVPTEVICKVAPQMTGSLKGDKSYPGVFDNSKIKRFVPEFSARTPFRTGVRESVAWLESHPELQNLSPKMDLLCEEVVAAWRKQAK
jgi:nucleoside-diphosphate-sugar epimerase